MSSPDSTSAALERVMVRFGTMLRSVGRRRGLRDADLDELQQDVRVRLWRSLVEREKIDQVQSSYVYRAAMSAAVDMIRQKRNRQEEPVDFEFEGEGSTSMTTVTSSGPETDLEQREMGETIYREVSQLAEPRDVIVRLYLSGYDRFEIARMLGWTEAKVRNLLYRGLADLREALTHVGIGQPWTT
jgi:RNA polymerase sigma-70 factor (ECF subfamily)